MNILKIAFKNIADNPFRSWAVAICTALVAGLIIGATLIVRSEAQVGTEVVVVINGQS